MAGIATASPTKNILMTMSATVFRWAVSAPPRRWPMSSLSWGHRAPTGSTAGTYQSMGWNNPMRRWIDGHFSVWRGLLDDPYRAPFARRAGSTGPISVRLLRTPPPHQKPSVRSVLAKPPLGHCRIEVPKDGLQLVAQPAARSPADRSREKQRMISATARTVATCVLLHIVRARRAAGVPLCPPRAR